MEIYCDGSCSPNTGMGAAVYIKYLCPSNDIMDYNVILIKPDEKKATSPRAEIISIQYALSVTSTVPEMECTIYNDNEYAVKTFNEYYPNWIRKGDFNKKSGKPHAHLDLLTPMYTYFASQQPRIKIIHVRGHVGVIGNEIADVYAKQAALLAPGTVTTLLHQ